MKEPAKRMYDALLDHARTIDGTPDVHQMTQRIHDEAPEPGVALGVQMYLCHAAVSIGGQAIPEPKLDPILGTEHYIDFLFTVWTLSREPKYLVAIARQMKTADVAVKAYAEEMNGWHMAENKQYKREMPRVLQIEIGATIQ